MIYKLHSGLECLKLGIEDSDLIGSKPLPFKGKDFPLFNPLGRTRRNQLKNWFFFLFMLKPFDPLSVL